MPTKLTKDLLKEKFVEMCREEMADSYYQENVNQGIKSYAKLTEMAQETDSPARTALFYTMSNYLDDVLKLYTKHGLGRIMNGKYDNDLYRKMKEDGLLNTTAPEGSDAKQKIEFKTKVDDEFSRVYESCKFDDSTEVTEYNEAAEALDDKIKNFTKYDSNTYAAQAIDPFLKAYDTKRLQLINGLVEKLSSGKEFDKKTFTKEERAFITIAAETAHAGLNKAMFWEDSEYFSKEQSDQLRLRVNMLDGKENDYSIPGNTTGSKKASSLLYQMGTDKIVINTNQNDLDDSFDEIPADEKSPTESLRDNQLASLNEMMSTDSLKAGKYAVFSLSNSLELSKMTASEFIEKVKADDTSNEQSQWAEEMTDAFLAKLNKNGENYTIDNLMVDGKFINGYSDLDKKEKFVAAALDGKKLDLATMEKDDNGNITSGKTMPIQLNDCMEKSWSFIEWLKSLFGLDRESRVKAANESVRDESKRQNNQERIKMSFEDLLGDSGNTRKTVKSQSSEMENSLERKSLDESFL